jgi:hypothetical protein
MKLLRGLLIPAVSMVDSLAIRPGLPAVVADSVPPALSLVDFENPQAILPTANQAQRRSATPTRRDRFSPVESRLRMMNVSTISCRRRRSRI